MFHYGQLTRKGGVDPRQLTFAVLDLETTGLEPDQGARVCEIGIVRMRGDGTILDEYATLVNPGVRITNEELHEITDADVAHAPTFDQIAGDVLAYLRDAIVVSHYLEFEEKFLAAEFRRLGVNLQGVPGLCTLVTAQTQLDRRGYRGGYRMATLAHLVTGEWPVAQHSALGDARALATMLTVLLTEARRSRCSGSAPPRCRCRSCHAVGRSHPGRPGCGKVGKVGSPPSPPGCPAWRTRPHPVRRGCGTTAHC